MTAPAPTGIARFVSRARAQRLVAQGRLLVSAFALLAALVGTLRSGDSPVTLVILAWWTALAALVFLGSRRHHATVPTAVVVIVDVIVIVTILLNTGGVASPFFLLLVLPPFAVSLLYGGRAIAMMIPFGLAIYAGALVVTSGNLDPRLSIMRFAAVLLLALGAVQRTSYDSRMQEDLEQLANWPRNLAPDRDESIRELLAQAALTLRAPRAALVWSEEVVARTPRCSASRS